MTQLRSKHVSCCSLNSGFFFFLCRNEKGRLNFVSERIKLVYISVKSKLQHPPPPRAYPGHLTPLPSRGGGNLIIRVLQGVGNLNRTLDFM